MLIVGYICHREEKTTKLDIRVKFQKKQLLIIEEKIDENDSYQRRDTNVLSGTIIFSESNTEKCPAVVQIGTNCKLVQIASLQIGER